MPRRDPTIRSRELGEGLRKAMKKAGLSGKQAARLLDVTPSYVSIRAGCSSTAPECPNSSSR
ncbi:MAG: helix-turn-helix domain-containing protein [Pseudonocardiaceae bacterium]